MTPEEEKERALWRQQKHLEIKEELQQNEKLQQFLENVYPTSREGFISDYAKEKTWWLEWGPKNIEWLEGEDLRWVNDAAERLKEIQQKKLFDLQCLWRAEKIQLEGIEISWDFRNWERIIFSCPFLEPVTEEEVDIYIQYLQSDNFEHQQGFMDSWQDYQGIKEAYNNEEEASRNFPDWYDFHNGRTGLSAYLLLPDIRGEKEEFYLDLWQKEYERKREEEKKKKEEELKKAPAIVAASAPAAAPEQDRRPHLGYHNKGWMSWFVKTFEDKETQEKFEKSGGERTFNDNNEGLQEDLRLLGRADKTMPIQGWFDWKEAIHKSADKYRREKIAESLPVAYEQYRLQVDLKIPFPDPDPLRFIFGNWQREGILRGRELNGEPRNFDF